MWQYEIFNMDMYHIVHTFILFSFLGFLMECVVLTIETRKLVTNRGFMKGPFCIIYGFGALIIPALLRPFSHNLILLFIAGMVLATLFEYLTGITMLRLFGNFWWDYSNKPCNYRGILCLESSLGWGVLAVLYFTVLERLTTGFIDLIPMPLGRFIGVAALIYFPLDFFYHLVKRLRGRRADRREAAEEALLEEEVQTADTLS